MLPELSSVKTTSNGASPEGCAAAPQAPPRRSTRTQATVVLSTTGRKENEGDGRTVPGGMRDRLRSFGLKIDIKNQVAFKLGLHF